MIDQIYAMAPDKSGGGGIGMFLPLIAIILIFYLLIIRPQHRRQKEQQAMIDSLKKGDKIVTAGGIHGTIIRIKESDGTIVLNIADKVNIEISKASVSRVKS